MINTPFFRVITFAINSLFGVWTAAQTPSPSPVPLPTVRLGFLYPLTGNNTSSDRQVINALGLSIQDFNSASKSFLFDAVDGLLSPRFDTEGDPDVALSSFDGLAREYHNSILFILGIVSSENLRHIINERYGDLSSPEKRDTLNRVRCESSVHPLLLSCCSTFPNLAIPDAAFRFLPDDSKQARFLAQTLVDSGKKGIAVIHRDDQWGRQLQMDT